MSGTATVVKLSVILKCSWTNAYHLLGHWPVALCSVAATRQTCANVFSIQHEVSVGNGDCEN